jgi:hypothetical protein
MVKLFFRFVKSQEMATKAQKLALFPKNSRNFANKDAGSIGKMII